MRFTRKKNIRPKYNSIKQKRVTSDKDNKHVSLKGAFGPKKMIYW